MTETSGTPVIYPTEICVVAVRHDHCYCSWSANTACSSMEDSSSTTDMQETESPEMLKYNLNLVLRKIKACRKKMKLKNATIRRLKRKLTSLSSIISELKAKDLIETKHMLPSGKASCKYKQYIAFFPRIWTSISSFCWQYDKLHITKQDIFQYIFCVQTWD